MTSFEITELPRLGAEESETLLVRPGAGDLRWEKPPGDMLAAAEWSENTPGAGVAWPPVLPSQVRQ